MALTTESALRKDKTNASSKMEHRHFATIAAIIANLSDSTTAHGTTYKNAVAHDFADALERTNPRFDRDRFLRACGVS